MEYVINIASPSPAQDDFETLRDEIRNFVDNHAEHIKVSSAYSDVMEGVGVHRPGFRFQFWFKDEKLAEEFRAKFGGCWVVEGLRPPETGFRTTKNGASYYAPYLPQFVDTGYTFRRETQHGTQVRNSEADEWLYFWDLPINDMHL